MPHGAFLFKKLDTATRKFEYTLQTGSDRRVARASGFPGEGLRRIVQQAWFTNALTSTYNSLANVTIYHGVRVMPFLFNSSFDFRPIFRALGNILYTFGVSFLLPVYVVTLVKEKEDRILIMMQMNGLKLWIYYFVHYCHFYSMHILSSTVFIITGVISRLDFFVRTDPLVYIILFFMWGHAQITLAFLISTLFSKNRTAFSE